MKRAVYGLIVCVVWISGCADPAPYRTGKLDEDKSCAEIYAKDNPSKPLSSATQAEQTCWKRRIEEHARYDLLFAEFTDQGWVQGSSGLDRPARDYLDDFLRTLDQLHGKYQGDARYEGLSLVVFVHGWHHNAQADDPDVVKFRGFLANMAELESEIARPKGKSRRVIGIFIGWRGESVPIRWLNDLTFWERKNTAERISLGTVRELLERLDLFRDRSRGKKNDRDVRMLTIGHSFGGLITYASMGGEFVRNAVRFKERRQGSEFDKFMSRIGDLVVIVNPAFEGARYEPLHTAGQRLCGVEPNQLPVLVVATSRGDQATGFWFPFARWLSTTFEQTSGHEADAIVKAVGHNERYITHELALCKEDNPSCIKECTIPSRPAQEPVRSRGIQNIAGEYQYMQRFASNGFGRTEYLCWGLELKATEQWHPKDNPFWVVRTTKDVIHDHGDVFNPYFVAFFRQLYLGFIYARRTLGDKEERNPCQPG